MDTSGLLVAIAIVWWSTFAAVFLVGMEWADKAPVKR